jgi:hypothetical protein
VEAADSPVPKPRRAFRLGDRAAERVLGVIGLGLLAYAAVLDAITLTKAPEPFGDEAWVGSAVWSFTHGHPLRPVIALGAGIYDKTFDYWMPRLGIVPQLVASLVGGTSLTSYRAASLAVTLIAFALLWRSLSRRYGTGPAAAAVAAVATTWVVFEASHYVRWDDVTFLWATLVLGIVLRGQPGVRAAAVLGAMLGFAPDFSVPMVALVPAALLLVAWERAGRRRRVSFFATGLVGGLLVYLALHVLPDPYEARRQWNLVYSGAYKIPILASLENHSLHPILSERDRYSALAVAPFRASRWVLYVAIAGSVGVLAARLRRGMYPIAAVGSLLLLSQLAGLALLYANHGAMYLIGAMPFAALALLELFALVPRRIPAAALAVVVLGALTLVGASTISNAASSDPRGAAANAQLSATAKSLVPKDGTAMGDYVYWWLFRDDRFRFNADIWFAEYHDHLSFQQAFARVCPNLVVLDDFWLARYSDFGPTSLGHRFPGLAPFDTREENKLMGVLFRDYRYPPRLEVAGGRAVELWSRKRACT